MSERILRALYEGDLKIGDITIPCSVLEGGIRVLSRRGVNTALGGSIGGLTRDVNSGGRNLPRILGTKSVKPFVSEELMAGAKSAYEFHPLHGGRTAFGYEATLLPLMCETVIDADRAGAIRNPDAVGMAETLLRGFARVGIIALVDEATGYQEIRDREALQQILDKYLRVDWAAAWAKRFPDEFYREMFRLRGWQWRGMKVNRPSVVAHYTKDLIYQRLAPGILDELERRNPQNDKGNRKHKHHQWLTGDIGVPALAQHLYAIIGFMRAAATWDQFYRMVQRAFPKLNTTLFLDFPEPEDGSGT
jgi:P63C domain